MPLIEGATGPQTLGDGVQTRARFDREGGLAVSELHGRYTEQARRGNIFSIASQAVATTTVGLATTYTGLCVANPIQSTVRVALFKATIMQSVIQATNIEAYAIGFGFNQTTNVTLTAAVTPQSTLIGSGISSKATAATSATLPTAPLYGAFMTNTPSVTTNAGGQQLDFEGSVVLLPGAYAMFVTPAQASVAGMWFSFMWEEIPV